MTDDIKVLQAEFPAYRIWRETVRNQSRFVAQRQRQVLGPHTVITPDVDELRTALLPALPVRRSPVPAAERQAG